MLRGVYGLVYGKLPEPPDEGRATGLVLVADGVGGLDLCGMALRYAAARAGLRHRVQVVGWGHGFGRWYRDLTNVANHVAQGRRGRRRGRRVPGATARRRRCSWWGSRAGPGSWSGRWKRCPKSAVETVVLIAPALSPEYDLSRALRAVRREMVVFWSPLDAIILGPGTSLFGTIDRVRSPGAGMVGFRRPERRRHRAVRQTAPGALAPADVVDRLPRRPRRPGQPEVPSQVCRSPAGGWDRIGRGAGGGVKPRAVCADNVMAHRRGRTPPHPERCPSRRRAAHCSRHAGVSALPDRSSLPDLVPLRLVIPADSRHNVGVAGSLASRPARARRAAARVRVPARTLAPSRPAGLVWRHPARLPTGRKAGERPKNWHPGDPHRVAVPALDPEHLRHSTRIMHPRREQGRPALTSLFPDAGRSAWAAAGSALPPAIRAISARSLTPP